MSKLSEYSKFDHLDEYDDDDNDNEEKEKLKQQQKHQQPQRQPQQHGQNDSVNHGNGNHQQVSPAQPPISQDQSTSSSNTPLVPVARMYPKQSNSKSSGNGMNTFRRSIFIFECNNQMIYEWEQGLTDVIITIPGPPSVRLKSNDIQCVIAPNHLQLKLKNSNQYFIDEHFYETIDVHESTWTIEEYDDDDNNDKPSSLNQVDPKKEEGNIQKQQQLKMKNHIQQQKIVIYLQKVAKGSVWLSALKGRFDNIQIDQYHCEVVKQEILKERWQEENPTMDFSEASFNNSTLIPDPRTYMGGVRYN